MHNHIKLSLTDAIKALQNDPHNKNQLALLEGLRNFGCRLLCIPRLCMTKLGDSTSATPTLVQIGDDDLSPTGVNGWNKDVLISILSRSNFVMVHACVADQFYKLLPVITFMGSKGTLIECTPEYFKEWADFAQQHAQQAEFIGVYPKDLELPKLSQVMAVKYEEACNEIM